MRARLLLPIVALTAALARPSAAQGTDAAAATALFLEGREAAKKGDYTTACIKLEESLRLDAAVGTLLNLADCQEHIGRLATAWQLFQQAADQTSPSDKRYGSAKARVAMLDARLPRLSVALAPGAPPGTQVTRDGVTLGAGSFHTPLPVDPGAHVIVVIAPGREERRYPIEMREFKTERVVVEPGAPVAPPAPPPPAPPPAPIAPPPAPPPPPGSDGKLRVAGFMIGGVGVASVGAAVATGLALPSKQRTVDQHCGAAVHLPANRCDAVGFDAALSGKTLAAVNTATWIAGGLAAAAGVALVVAGSVSGNKPGAAVQVGASAGLTGVMLEGRFE